MNTSESGRPLPLASRLERLCRAVDGPFAHYLPIEFFKWFPEDFKPEGTATCFLSSGTTQKDRSRSYFSQEGLARYRAVAEGTFYRVLADFFGDPHATPGLSLVPPVREWPDSSLARMVGWLSETSPVTYVSDDPRQWSAPPRQPVWVFGTGFHFVNLIDSGWRFPLPAGSVVFETGGTKGRTRSVTRDELYEGIARVFAIPTERIISEYGMCELASQAYDWVKPGVTTRFEDRRFRFPEHVRVFAHEGRGRFQAEGSGSLALWDPERIDYPWCLRTQDLATVWEDGSFRLEGRVPQAVLKGCSLPFEKIAEAAPSVSPKSVQHVVTWDKAAARKRLPQVTRLWNEFLSQEDLTAALEAEWGSRVLARWALRDLRASAPKTDDEWLKAAEAAFGEAGKAPATWLLILPQTHGMTSFHPMVLGLLAGCGFYVRTTREGDVDLESNWLALTKKYFPEQVHLLPSAFRIGQDSVPPAVDALMCFASDATLTRLRTLAGLPVQGFGNALTISVLHGPFDNGAAENLAKDAFSLGQRGCLSTRLAVLVTDEVPTAWTRTVLEQVDVTVPTPLAQALDQEVMERVACSDTCEVIESSRGSGPIAIVHHYKKGEDLTKLVSLRPFVLPLLLVSPKDEASVLSALCESFPETRHVTSNVLKHWPSRTVSRRELGEGNAPLWNGFHEGRALFVLKEGSS